MVKVRELVVKLSGRRTSQPLIPILHLAQAEFGWLAKSRSDGIRCRGFENTAHRSV